MKRRYLIIVMDLSDLAAAIVFKRIIKSMIKYVDCDVICPKIDEYSKSLFTTLPCTNFWQLPSRIERKLNNFIGFNFAENLWSIANYLKLNRIIKHKNYDLILSLVYGSNFGSIILGNMVKKNIRLPWVVYTVDAIPVPLAWAQNHKIRNKKLHLLKNYISNADALFSANPVMMKYEKETLSYNRGISGVVLTPCNEMIYNDNIVDYHDSITFLYTGYLYGPRKIDSLLAGFELYLADNPSAKLVFVGDNNILHFKGYEHLIKSGAISLNEFTKDIAPYYNLSDVLIDINANIENDVFLSSKVCNYLSYNKPILVVSQDGSPVRLLMSGYESIVHCHHDKEEIYQAMKQAANLVGCQITDRSDLQKQFMPDTVAKKFCDELNIILENRNS